MTKDEMLAHLNAVGFSGNDISVAARVFLRAAMQVKEGRTLHYLCVHPSERVIADRLVTVGLLRRNGNEIAINRN
jgi:hypothetical protein